MKKTLLALLVLGSLGGEALADGGVAGGVDLFVERTSAVSFGWADCTDLFGSPCLLEHFWNGTHGIEWFLARETYEYYSRTGFHRRLIGRPAYPECYFAALGVTKRGMFVESENIFQSATYCTPPPPPPPDDCCGFCTPRCPENCGGDPPPLGPSSLLVPTGLLDCGHPHGPIPPEGPIDEERKRPIPY